MSEWHRFDNELPPIGKKLIIGKDNQSPLAVLKLGYMFESEDDRSWPRVSTEEQIKAQGGYWLEIPLLPEPPK